MYTHLYSVEFESQKYGFKSKPEMVEFLKKTKGNVKLLEDDKGNIHISPSKESFQIVLNGLDSYNYKLTDLVAMPIL